MRYFKRFLGFICCFLCLGPIGLALENKQPLYLLEILIFAPLALLFFRSSKKPKRKAETIKYTSVIADEPITVQVDFPHYPNENTDIPGNAYLYSKTGKVIGRVDGEKINDADASFLMRSGYYAARREFDERMSRGMTQNIITQEDLNPREVLFFKSFSRCLLENKLNPGFVKIDRLSSGVLNVFYSSIYVGKVYISEKEELKEYRVVREGNSRATRVFDNIIDTENYIFDKVGYHIEERTIHTVCWIQCLNTEDIESTDVDKVINAIPKWIKYIKQCIREWGVIL